jgi:hypothetical protein
VQYRVVISFFIRSFDLGGRRFGNDRYEFYQCLWNVYSDSASLLPPISSLRGVMRLVTLLLILRIVSSVVFKVPSTTVPTALRPTSVLLCIITTSKHNFHNTPTNSWNIESSGTMLTSRIEELRHRSVNDLQVEVCQKWRLRPLPRSPLLLHLLLSTTG